MKVGDFAAEAVDFAESKAPFERGHELAHFDVERFAGRVGAMIARRAIGEVKAKRVGRTGQGGVLDDAIDRLEGGVFELFERRMHRDGKLIEEGFVGRALITGQDEGGRGFEKDFQPRLILDAAHQAGERLPSRLGYVFEMLARQIEEVVGLLAFAVLLRHPKRELVRLVRYTETRQRPAHGPGQRIVCLDAHGQAQQVRHRQVRIAPTHGMKVDERHQMHGVQDFKIPQSARGPAHRVHRITVTHDRRLVVRRQRQTLAVHPPRIQRRTHTPHIQMLTRTHAQKSVDERGNVTGMYATSAVIGCILSRDSPASFARDPKSAYASMRALILP